MPTTAGQITGRNADITIGTQNVSGSSNMVAIRPEKEVAAFAAFGDDWEHVAANIKRWSGVVRAIYSEVASEAMEELWAAFESMDAVAIEFQPSGDTSTNWQFTGSVHVTGGPIEVDRTGGIITVEFPFTGTGTLTQGTVA
jgi:hypothetical protein